MDKPKSPQELEKEEVKLYLQALSEYDEQQIEKILSGPTYILYKNQIDAYKGAITTNIPGSDPLVSAREYKESKRLTTNDRRK